MFGLFKKTKKKSNYQEKRQVVENLMTGNYKLNFGNETEILKKLKSLVFPLAEKYYSFIDSSSNSEAIAFKHKESMGISIASATIAAFFFMRFRRYENGYEVNDELMAFFSEIIDKFLFEMAIFVLLSKQGVEPTEKNIKRRKDQIIEFQHKLGEMFSFIIDAGKDETRFLMKIQNDRSLLIEPQKRIEKLLINTESRDLHLEKQLVKLVDDLIAIK